jgi:hypothetical protein
MLLATIPRTRQRARQALESLCQRRTHEIREDT